MAALGGVFLETVQLAAHAMNKRRTEVSREAPWRKAQVLGGRVAKLNEKSWPSAVVAHQKDTQPKSKISAPAAFRSPDSLARS